MKLETMNKKAQKLCDDFNKKCPVGSAVFVELDSGEKKQTVTTSEAQVMSCSAVIWLEGIRGAYSLERVSANF